MSLFTNKNFISQLIKQYGATDYFDQQTFAVLQSLIQAETRKMVQTASKFMHSDRRDYLTQEDIENALRQLSHEDLIHPYHKPNTYKQDNTQLLLQDPIHKDISLVIESEMKSLQSFSMPTLRGRYIYLNSKIPKINENHQLKSLEDLNQIKLRQNEEKKKNFNIIRDEPEAQLTKEEIDYYNEIVGFLTNNVGSGNGKEAQTQGENDSHDGDNWKSKEIEVKGCIVNVLPLILKFIINLGVNENCITFILKALENKFVWSSLEYNLHQVLIILIAYEGQRCLQVGQKVGRIVNRFGEKYPNLYDIFEQLQPTYPTITKQVGFELVTGIPLKLSYQQLKSIEAQSNSNSKDASICMRALLESWSSLSCLKDRRICEQYGYVYWYACKELQADPYLGMW